MCLRIVIFLIGTISAEHLNFTQVINDSKSTIKVLQGKTYFNNLGTLEPQMSSASGTKYLEFRAHVWYAFHLHVSAWNEQLATLNRKADIISKGQEKIMELQPKINDINNVEIKLEEFSRKLENIQDSLAHLQEGMINVQTHKSHDYLFGELRTKPNDIVSKVDVIFERISGHAGKRDGYDRSGRAEIPTELDAPEGKKVVKRTVQLEQPAILEILERTRLIERTTTQILDKQNHTLKLFQPEFWNCTFAPLFKPAQDVLYENIFQEPEKGSCESLNPEFNADGVYFFGREAQDSKLIRSYNLKYCTYKNGYWWTVIQRRDNYTKQENFSRSWSDYKTGFGQLDKDFWFGNDFIANLTQWPKILRVELEDFQGNAVWAEYSKFLVVKNSFFHLYVDGYSGNATDALWSHNGAAFSTADVKQDSAPECCPCAASYGGGWWFNSCFEANLNGIYHKSPKRNRYFQGIIWETWLGNYSLKRSVMLVRDVTRADLEKLNSSTSTEIPYYEDP